MEQSLDPLVEAAVSSLSDNAEHRLAAIAILSETAIPDHPDAGEAIARWKGIDATKRPFLWKPVLWVIALITAIVLVSSQYQDLRRAWSYRNIADLDIPDPIIPSGLSARQKLLFNDPLRSGLEQAEALHNSEPENPAYYAEYAHEYVRQYGEVPTDYFETVSRTAPGNSYFHYLAVGTIDWDVVDQKPFTGTLPKPRVVEGVTLSQESVEREFEIKDAAAFGKSLSLLEKAAALPDFENYQAQMFAARLRALPTDRTSAERINDSTLVFGGSRGLISLSKVATVLSARAQQLSNEGDAEGFLALDGIRRHLMRGLLNCPEKFLLDEIIMVGMFASTAEYFHHASKRLGLEEMSDELLAQNQGLRDANDRRRLRSKKADHSWIIERGSVVSGASIPFVIDFVDTPPPLIAGDLAPLRHADHAVAMRAGLAALCVIVIASSIIVFLFRYLFHSALRETAGRLVQLLRGGDWVIAASLGVVLPIGSIFALQHFTDLGGRGWALEHFHFLFPAVHLAAILLLTLLAPALVIRWRLSCRIAPLGIPCRPGIFPMMALAAVLAASVAAYPLVVKFGMDTLFPKAFAAVPALWLAVVFGNAVRAVTGKAGHRISLAATSIALLPLYAFALILLSLSLSAFSALEMRHLRQDTLFNLDIEPPCAGQYEIRLAAQKRKETKAIMGFEN
jgi:hypothetical protein